MSIRFRPLRAAARSVLLIALGVLPALATGPTAHADVGIQALELSPTNFQAWIFRPAAIEVPVGEPVVWTNSGSILHTVTASDGSFESGDWNPGARFSWVPSAPGQFSYFCTYHPWMAGRITVIQPDPAPPAGETTDADTLGVTADPA